MSNLATIQALVTAPAVDSWATSLMRSRPGYFRADCVNGLRGAALLAVGATHDVDVVVALPLRESAIVVDGEKFTLRFLRG